MTGNSELVLRDLFDADPDVAAAFGDRGCRVWSEEYHRVNRELWRRYENGTISREALRLERFATPLELAGLPRHRAEEAARRLDTDYLSRLGRCPGTVPGARSAVEAVRAAGLPVGIVSNGFREVQYCKLASAGMDGIFDPIVLSDDVGFNKPSPRFFEAAAAAAGVEPQQCVIVGDNLRGDILGALRAGWSRAYWLVRPDATDDPADVEAALADERCTPFSDMAALPELMGI